MANLKNLFLQGGRGSGNFGHRGRPGQKGGSAPGSGGAPSGSGSSDKDKKWASEHVSSKKRAEALTREFLKGFKIEDAFDEDSEWTPAASKRLDEILSTIEDDEERRAMEELVSANLSDYYDYREEDEEE